MKEIFMKRAIELAEKGRGFTSPNPLVGAVIVRDDQIIGQGYHKKYGELHAERDALISCSQSAKGATMYVTLEPCAHQGKQPPCVEAIVDAGITKVVIGSRDPNPMVAGKGVKFLKSNGIEVVEDFLKKECDELNDIFFHYITSRKPYIALKYAMTLDGKIATQEGVSKWITEEDTRRYVHKLRRDYTAIMVGIGTVLADNPMLNCRIENPKNPIRIICDSMLKMPLDSKIVSTASEIRTVVATISKDKVKISKLQENSIEVLQVEELNNHIDIKDLVDRLGRIGIDSILVEGGASINWSLIESGLVSKVYTFIAPKILGGVYAKTPVAGLGFESPDLSEMFKIKSTMMFKKDILIESEVICLQE